MRYLYLVLLFCLSLGLNAQSPKELAQAKIDYRNKAYNKALPVFESAYLAKPTDPSLGLWYAVCLIETGGDLQKAEECLVLASKRNLPESYLYLGDIYVKNYRVSEAEQLYARYAKARPKDKEALTERQDVLSKMNRSIARTEDIQVIDSLVVDKNLFLSAYKLSPEGGSLLRFSDVFEGGQNVESTVYKNEKGTKIYFGEPDKKRYALFSMDQLLSGFGNKQLISNNNFGLSGDVSYPFVLTDGSTIYFSAKDDNGLGGYDIYVTRYNFNNNSYLAPEMLNMPFNSPANDYLYVYDEEKGVGWFATDRFQPEGKLCVYTFIPNEEVMLVESDDSGYQEGRARLSSIRKTWRPGKSYTAIKEKAGQNVIREEKKSVEFIFVINDLNVYQSYQDFKSQTARGYFRNMESRKESLNALNADLDEIRTRYNKSSAAQREGLAKSILNLENQQELLVKEIADLEVKARNEEIKALN